MLPLRRHRTRRSTVNRKLEFIAMRTHRGRSSASIECATLHELGAIVFDIWRGVGRVGNLEPQPRRRKSMKCVTCGGLETSRSFTTSIHHAKAVTHDDFFPRIEVGRALTAHLE